MISPKPDSRPRKVSFWRYLRLFRQDILSSQPEHLFSAKMARFKTPFFQSALINEPDLIEQVLRARPDDFPKSRRIAEGLIPLLGEDSIFVTNNEIWNRQRRIIDPVFEGGRIREMFPAMQAAARACVVRAQTGNLDVESLTSHAMADVIFRSMFSMPIEDRTAQEVYREFRIYQRVQPLLNLAAFLPLPRWIPRVHSQTARDSATKIRGLLADLVSERQRAVSHGQAPDDLSTRLICARDPQSGSGLSEQELIDQIAIFFLAGHETSASTLAWALYLLAADLVSQNKVRDEAAAFLREDRFSGLSKMPFTRDVIRETLRLYPPVPMMVRKARRSERFRDESLKKGTQIVISPWHLHRNPRLWSNPDDFIPARWQDVDQKHAQRNGYLPFSAGARVCPGAGFAMTEITLMLAYLLAEFEFHTLPDKTPVPVAHLTLRGRDGIWLDIRKLSGKSVG